MRTIRHWPERKLYVKKRGKPSGGAGSIVVIFDQDEAEKKENSAEKFPWCTTWLGEHQQESDMAFYAMRIGENLVGPGISRCKYGGFLLSYPPRRMFDVWQDSALLCVSVYALSLSEIRHIITSSFSA